MPAAFFAMLTTEQDASWFLVQKARELQEHSAVPSSEMLFVSQDSQGTRTLAVRLKKHMLSFRTLENAVPKAARLCQISDLGEVSLAPRFCFVLLTAPLHHRVQFLGSFLSSDCVDEAYVPVCPEAHIDGATLALQLGTQPSPVIRSLVPGPVEFLKRQDEWHCEWPDRPHWMVPKLLVEICRFLAVRQRMFLDCGISHLAPLGLAEVSKHVGCHLSSVSRVLKGMQAQTKWGLMPLISFFAKYVPSDDQPVSQTQVKARIVEIIAGEDKENPLSDEAITQSLNQSGITISRRAVTKYRLRNCLQTRIS